MDYEQVLTRLCSAGAPSGFEGAAAELAQELLRPLMDEVSVDRMGSVVGVRRCGKAGAPRLLLDAHLDEVGFIVTGHWEGFLTLAPLGGIDPRVLPDRELLVLTRPPRFGVVACLPPHIQTKEDHDRAIPLNQLYVDMGLSQEEAERLIPIGTPVVYRSSCFPMGDGFFCGKSLDDRSCFSVLLGALELLKECQLDVDLYVVGSVREENHMTGAVTSAFSIAPDLCVAVDVTHGSSPDTTAFEAFPLGGGPAIGLGPNCTPWISARLMRKAEELGIGYDTEVMAGSSGTNGWPIQITREGVATAVLSVPLRYMHTPMETICLSDLEDTARLLAAFIQNLGEEVPTYA